MIGGCATISAVSVGALVSRYRKVGEVGTVIVPSFIADRCSLADYLRGYRGDPL